MLQGDEYLAERMMEQAVQDRRREAEQQRLLLQARGGARTPASQALLWLAARLGHLLTVAGGWLEQVSCPQARDAAAQVSIQKGRAH
jgi:hypothetical protein